MNVRLLGSASALAVMAITAGCDVRSGAVMRSVESQASATPPQRQDDPALLEARQVFGSRCVACHGAEGRGDGPAAASLVPRPRNYTDKVWQAATSDSGIEKVILEGGPAVGKSPIMPPNPDLAGKPQVLAALRQLVRDFGR